MILFRIVNPHEPPRSKLRGIEDRKEQSKLRGIYPEKLKKKGAP
jgi:hypothetical protein